MDSEKMQTQAYQDLGAENLWYAPTQKTPLEKDLETKSHSIKFRYLKRGIEVVEELGYQKALHLYQTDPKKFRDMLI